MMKRADKTYVPAEGCSAMEIIQCLTAEDFDACKAACSNEAEEEQDPEEVKAGTLNVTMTSEEGGDVPNGVSALPVVTYTLKAADEDINISSLVLSQAGYGHDDTITNVALFINGQRVSKAKNLDLDKDLTLNLTNAYALKAGKSVDIEVRATVGTTANAKGSQFAIELKDVDSSAEKVKLPSNAKSNTFKVVNTEAASATLASRGAVNAPKAGTTNVDIFEFSIAGSSSQDVTLKNITFMGLGGAAPSTTNAKNYEDYLENLELVLDGTVVATAKKMNGKYLTFNVNKDVVIEKDKTEIFTVKADVVGGANETLDFVVEDPMDVVLYGNTYNTPVSILDANTTPATANHYFVGANATAAANMPTRAAVEISAGKVVIERTNPTETTFTKSRKNVYLGSFTINNNGDNNLTLEKMGLKVTSAGATNSEEYIEAIKVRYGSTSAGLTVLDMPVGGAVDGAVLTDEPDLTISKKTTVYVYADIASKKVIAGGALNLTNETFNISLNKASFKITESENDKTVTEVSFPAAFTTMEAGNSDLTVTQVTLGNKSFSKGAADIDAVSFKAKTSAQAGVKIKSLKFVATSNAYAKAKVTLDGTNTTKTAGDPTGVAGWKYEKNVTATDTTAYLIAATTADLTTLPANTFNGIDDAVANSAVLLQNGEDTIDSNTIRNAKLIVNDKDTYDATIATNAITVKTPITLDADTTNTFVLRVSLESEPYAYSFDYTLDISETLAEDTTSDKNTLDFSTATDVNGRTISVLQNGTVTLSYEANNTNNKNAKSILAGNGVVVAEYNLYATHEQAKAKNIVLTFNAPSIKDSADDVEIYYGDTLVASNPTWDNTKLIATFSNVNLTITEEETPLTVKIVSSAINSDGGAAVKGASITSIEFTNVSGKTSGITINGVNETTDSSLFDIAPVTLATSVANVSTSNTSTFNVLATRGSNTNSDGVVAKATLGFVYLNVTSNNALTALTIKDTDGNTVVSACNAYSDANYSSATTLSKSVTTAYVKCTMNANYLIGNGGEGTDLVVEATVDGSVNTPSYTLSLKGVEYTTNASNATVFSDRAASVKNLISK